MATQAALPCGARLLAFVSACGAALAACSGPGGSARPSSAAGDRPQPRPAPFPAWEERVLHQWTNRARADPRAALAGCRECPDRDCYAPVPPLEWSPALNRAARFHADEMRRQGFFLHDSQCRLASDLGARYPGACDGARACACQGGGTMRFSERLRLFGVDRPSGEVQAEHPSDPDATFGYLLHEPTSSPACASSSENGHRWNLLTLKGTVGFGVSGSFTVGDFSRTPGAGRPVPSGAHYPRQAPTVEFWASWHAAAAPSAASVDVDGTCTPLALARGGPASGAWSASVSGLGSGCHRYRFVFRDASGTLVAHPERGSFGVGPEATCADWDETQPPPCG